MSDAGAVCAALVWCPFPDEAAAASVAAALLDERLIACANLFPAIRSLYAWQGERGDSREAGALFKTDAALLDATVARITELHPYDTPAVLGWRCESASTAKLAWLGAETEARR